MNISAETEWTYEGFWNAVFGLKTVAEIAEEAKGAPAVEGSEGRIDLDCWLDRLEDDAWSAGGVGGERPAIWYLFHDKAIARICQAAGVAL